MGQDHDGIVEKELAREMTEGRKEVKRAPSAANLTGTVTRTEEALEKAKARAKPCTATTAESRGTSK